MKVIRDPASTGPSRRSKAPYIVLNDKGVRVGIGRDFSVLLDGVDVTWKCCGASDGGDGSPAFVDTIKVKSGDPDVKPYQSGKAIAIQFVIENRRAVTIRRTGKIEIVRKLVRSC